MLMMSIALDSWYYGKFSLPAMNFLKFNVLSGQSKYFGTHSFLNYWVLYPLTQLAALYPFFVHGIVLNLKWHVQKKEFPLIF